MPSVSITTAATPIVPATGRNGLFIQNLSDTDVFVANFAAVTAGAGANAGLRVAANGGVLTIGRLDGGLMAPCSGWWGIHAGTGAKEIRCLEV